MGFSSNTFPTNTSTSKFSDDTMSHSNLVMACQWGWSRSPDLNSNSNRNGSLHTHSTSATLSSNPVSLFNIVRSKRFASCQGRLYHQLLCSHRIRTDMVEDCGANCVEPFENISGPAFICNECMQSEALHIWEDRKAQHNASYPAIEQMSKEQYDQWYLEHKQLETEYARDRISYESELRMNTRPSNICSALEVSNDDVEFATELESLSLSFMGPNKGGPTHTQLQYARGRVSLPNDASEQLHWDLNALTLSRGSCGAEYSASGSPNNVPSLHHATEDEL
ncbi:hypothetical protein GQ44DRAFT_610279 [Phaeosphaeriaceae sp. PMI808]|nr:hypothetical protein GQ44DRAFT_610279 [Phaeosphaeriaceae sp. PMI808]